MSILKNMNTSASLETERDSLGGFLLESGAYDMLIEMAYIKMSAAGAIGVALHLKDVNSNKIFKPVEYITTRTDKGGKNTYTDKEGKEKYLMGFSIINTLTNLAIGVDINTLDTEEKTIMLYNYDAGKDMPTNVQVITGLLGAPITVGIIKRTVNKNVKNNAGMYVASSETREENVIDKLFKANNKLTISEIKAGVTAPDFYDKWKTKYTGVTVDKSKKVAATPNDGTPGMPTMPKAPVMPDTHTNTDTNAVNTAKTNLFG